MSKESLNAFLTRAMAEPSLRAALRSADPVQATRLAEREGFGITVGDLIRYKERATSWRLTDPELAVVERWQSRRQPYWWQFLPEG